mmetsp:Transcript_51314/g.109089  ORF Transcript_51314/g.109089 Transcript_51314/m.109089 type:complete len:177 (-) Transcript_51314:1095-1625(-)
MLAAALAAGALLAAAAAAALKLLDTLIAPRCARSDSLAISQERTLRTAKSSGDSSKRVRSSSAKVAILEGRLGARELPLLCGSLSHDLVGIEPAETSPKLGASSLVVFRSWVVPPPRTRCVRLPQDGVGPKIARLSIEEVIVSRPSERISDPSLLAGANNPGPKTSLSTAATEATE